MVIQLKSVVLSRIPKLRKVMTRIMRAGFRDLGAYWFRELLPDHFKPSARSEFQHQSRTEKYLKSKRFRGRGQGRFIDNILLGQSRRFLTHGPSIKATGTGVTIRLDAPLYFRKTPPGQPDQVAEIIRISDRHRNLINRRFENKVRTLVDRFLRTTSPEQVK